MLTGCPSCRRHVRRTDDRCPFCNVAMQHAERSAPPARRARALLVGSFLAATAASRAAHADAGMSDAEGAAEDASADALTDGAADAPYDYPGDIAGYGCASAPAGTSALGAPALLALAAMSRRLRSRS